MQLRAYQQESIDELLKAEKQRQIKERKDAADLERKTLNEVWGQ